MTNRPSPTDRAESILRHKVTLREEPAAAATLRVPVLESLRDRASFVGEELRLLGARIREIRRERGQSCFGMTSALPGEGKSTVAVGLAAALARPGRRVLLVEADVRRPSLSRMLGLGPSRGLGEYLNGGADEVAVRRIEAGGFFVLVAGEVELEHPESLGSPRMKALLATARAGFDCVLLDIAPLLPVVDGVLLQELVDGFLLVVRSRQTRRAAIDEALAKLRPDKIVGVVLNDHTEYRASYRAYAYKAYGIGSTEGPARRESAAGADERRRHSGSD